MEYVYGAMLLHSVGKDINEENLKNVMAAAGAEVDEARVKSIVASLDGVDIEDAIKNAAPIGVAAAPAAAPAADAGAGKKAEAKPEEEEKSEEEAASGLAALFG